MDTNPHLITDVEQGPPEDAPRIDDLKKPLARWDDDGELDFDREFLSEFLTVSVRT